ncbi:MAG: hypothetical protein CVU97_05340 [Firmicutes bacterium HGW-Firmicutes-21]|nr:MAG: hypothetical protein CVU97_05340 [Firmicutes bacterium HGW-Firmicutes-21]
MSLDILKQRIKENKPSGVYLFYGKEEYTKDYYTRELRKKVLSSPLPEFNYIVFDASADTPTELAEAAFSLPYMWEHKLIEVRNLDISSLTVELAESYAEVIEDLPDYVILLFLFRDGELDEGIVENKYLNKKATAQTDDTQDNDNEEKTAPKGQNEGIHTLIDAIKKEGMALNFTNESGAKLENWIQKHFAARKAAVDISAVQTLITLCGNDMYTLHSEIEKLVCSPAERPISHNAVLEYCCPNESYKVYELSDALTSGDLKRVKQIYDNLTQNKTDPSMLLGYLSKCYSDMLIIQAALEEGKSHGKIAQLIKKNEWLVRRTAAGITKKPTGYIAFACEAIDIADRKLKRYSTNPYLVLEILLFRIGLYGRK